MKVKTASAVPIIIGALALGTTVGLSAEQGRIIGWGSKVVGVDLSGGFRAVAAGLGHNLGLKADGSIVAWGDNKYGQCDVPPTNTGYVAIAAGAEHSLGLKADGSIVAWGDNEYGQCKVPPPNTGYVAIAAGESHNFALRATGVGR